MGWMMWLSAAMFRRCAGSNELGRHRHFPPWVFLILPQRTLLCPLNHLGVTAGPGAGTSQSFKQKFQPDHFHSVSYTMVW